ncbi:hypothetical protein AGMMS49938_03830 [Fibrobacterales bacterium]|nr:hypothetical protein AGMMS49938_03830 [Fibrobacterales bacterium]
MTVEELRQIFVERDAKYAREQAEHDARLDAVSEDLREVAEGLKKNNAIVGNLSNKIGTLIESVVAPGIVKKYTVQ